jgi:hypothetical protein
VWVFTTNAILSLVIILHFITPPLQAAATPRTPQSPNTPLTPKLTGTSTHGPQFFDSAAPASGTAQPYGLELFLASEASAVVEHTKQ